MQVAIDGPASAGKSTVAKIIAQKLNFVYIDTGAMYRACTVIAYQQGLNYGDEKEILKAVAKEGLQLKSVNGKQKVFAGKKDITLTIRTPLISANVSQVAALPGVRKKMVALQRKMAGKTNVIMDGRDIGTTVLPHADLKIFLVASAHSRAERRLLDLKEKGIAHTQTAAQVEKEIAARDYKDSHRKLSPLKKATDAIEIDTTKMTIKQVVMRILQEIKKRQKNF